MILRISFILYLTLILGIAGQWDYEEDQREYIGKTIR